MKRVLAILLIIAAVLAWIYLTPHHINFLWYVLLAVTCIISLLLVIAPGDNKSKEYVIETDKKLASLVDAGEQIVPCFDDCEFRDYSYDHDVVDRIYTAGGITDKTLRNESVGHSIIIYRHLREGAVETFRQALPVDAESLKIYVMNGKVILYVDRDDRSNYSFDIKK